MNIPIGIVNCPAAQKCRNSHKNAKSPLQPACWHGHCILIQASMAVDEKETKNLNFKKEFIMTRKEVNKMAMVFAVKSVVAKHAATVEANAPLAETIGKLNTLTDAIGLKDNEYQTVKAGATKAKNLAMAEIITSTQPIANALFNFGRKTGDEQLKAECGFTISTLKRYREGKLVQRSNHLLDLAKKHAEDLVPYDVDIGRLETAIASYQAQAENLRQKKVDSIATRRFLDKDFDEVDDLLKKDLDKLVEMKKESDPKFYEEYRTAREIYDLGGSHISKNGKTEAAAPVAASEAVPAEEKLAA